MTDGLGESALARILVQSSVDGLFALDRESRYTLWNAAMETFAGKKAEDVLGRHIFDVFPFLRDLGLDRAIERAFAGETVVYPSLPNALPSGAVHHFDRHYSPLRDDGGAVVGMVGVVRDVTSRRDAEEALRSSQALLRVAVDASGIGLWSWDPERDEVTWDDSLCALFGVPQAPRDREEYLALVHPEDRERVAALITGGVAGGRWEGEHRIVRPDGTVRWILTKNAASQRDGRPIARGAVIDVTERRHREEQLRQAQKLEAVGQLTAGVAHNFNNILMGLLANLELAARGAPPELAPMLTGAEEAAVRASHLVRQLMTFAGRNRPTARTVESIGALVERTVAFCRTTFDRRIAIVGDYDASARARVDASQIEQSVVNILINARDALGDVPVAEARITLDVAVVPAGAPDVAGRAGEHVRVRIADTGVGMDSATMARVFEPFFTTKDVGKGTGLGLATTHAIARDHGGFVTCESTPGRGTTFCLYLVRETADVQATGATTAPTPARGTETILVVDDEAPIRHVVARMLDAGGYTPMLAASGQEAIDLLSDPTAAAKVALVLLDLSMPGMPAAELRRRLRELAPGARIVHFTGYAADAVDGLDGAERVLEKPVTSQRLLGTIREVLDVGR